MDFARTTCGAGIEVDGKGTAIVIERCVRIDNHIPGETKAMPGIGWKR